MALLLERELTSSPFGPFTVVHARRLSDALDRLQGERFDAVILDLGLPDSQGLETLDRARARVGRQTPIVVLTGNQDEEVGVRALQRGAEDYLVKDGATAELWARSLRYAIERARANEAVLASEQRLALAVDAVGMGIFEWEPATGKLAWSHHHARLFGLEPHEFDGTGAGVYNRIHPDDRDGVRAEARRCVASGDDYRHEFRVVWPDGSVHWIEARESDTVDHGRWAIDHVD